MLGINRLRQSIIGICWVASSSLTLIGCSGANDPASGQADLLSSSVDLKQGGGPSRRHCGPRGQLEAPSVPVGLEVPATAKLAARYHAVGTQIYTCLPSANANADGGVIDVWTFKAPSATLYNEHCCLAGSHFAGPTWASVDGSSVVASKVASATSPNPDSVPILLLKAVSNAGSGIFSNVTFVQRLDTEGGLAPTGPCDVEGVELAVPYEANYYFYTGGI